MNNIVAWQYNNTIHFKDLEKFELFAEMLEATITNDTFADMEVSDLDYIDEDTQENIAISIFFEDGIDKAAVEQELAALAAKNIALEAVYEQDWQEQSLNSFKPIEIGKFYIHSFDEQAEENKVSLKIPAKMAFGTGEHSTTKGCLYLYNELSKTHKFNNGLDMGCGSAILAMAANKADNVKFLAVDIDETAVEIAKDNLADNNLTNDVTIIFGDGFKADMVQNNAKYDIIFANILKNPLLEMSSELVNVLEDAGYVILSGFKQGEQKQEIIAKYSTELGLKIVAEFDENDWSAICLQK